MFAASGVLGLLLMGVAVGGLMAGTEDPAHSNDDDATDTDGARDDARGRDETTAERFWTGDFAADGSLEGARPSDARDAPLAKLLFSEKQDIRGAFFEHTLGLHSTAADAFATSEDPIPDPDMVEISDTIPFPGGPDIPCVLDFECGTDRLVLDFDGTRDEAPRITIDLDLLPGSAVIEANGIPVTLVEGAADLHPGDVDVVMSGVSLNPPEPDPVDGATDGPDVDMTPTETGFINLGADGEPHPLITDYDPAEDQIEVLYDPTLVSDPEVGVVDFEDETGASITLDGTPIIHVKGAQGLDPSRIILRPSANLPETSAGSA
jgi:hypothetical protein